jgi:hypothetical protein
MRSLIDAAPKTQRCYRTSGRAWAPTLGELHLSEIDQRGIATFVGARKKAGVADTTIRRDLAFLGSLCEMAQRWG